MRKVYDITITTIHLNNLTETDNIVETVIFGDSFGTRELAEKVVTALKRDKKYSSATLDIVERNLLETTEDLLASISEE